MYINTKFNPDWANCVDFLHNKLTLCDTPFESFTIYLYNIILFYMEKCPTDGPVLFTKYVCLNPVPAKLV